MPEEKDKLQSNPNSSITPLLSTAVRAGLRLILNQALGIQLVIEFVAGRMYTDEHRLADWKTVDVGTRALWCMRARTAITALADTVKLF